MPSIIARILVSLVIILAGPVLYPLILIGLREQTGMDRDLRLVAATIITPVPIFIAWLGVWTTQVRWTRQRVAATAAALAGSVLIGWLVFVAFTVMTRYSGPDGGGLIFGSMAGALAWFGLTPLAWKETKAEAETRRNQLGGENIACPVCGYNLTGLREAKCPECGASYTLDQLFAHLQSQAQPMRDAGGT